LAKDNAHVYINGRTTARVEAAIKKLKDETGNPNIEGFAVDFSDNKQIENLIRQLPDIDILVNNVGIFEPKPFKDISDADWLKFFEVNVLSGVRLSRAYFDKMIAKNWGRIIFISSESALQIPEEMIHYGTTKTAQLAVSRGLAELTKGTNVTVNTILPGPTFSEGAGDFIESLAKKEGKSIAEIEKDFFQYMRPTSILQRFTSPYEIASLVAFVASPLSSATNGAALRADGGVVKSII
jgi:NAD(P)-dependent dehydrogenase (short-subunit alcohol dehydrogenase family)